jgi:hypothetical protein
MQIIFGKENAELLREKYTVLELETFNVSGKLLEAYCVVPVENLAMDDILQVDDNIKLHDQYVAALKNNDVKLCTDLSEHLIGKWGGELDSFYKLTVDRITQETA